MSCAAKFPARPTAPNHERIRVTAQLVEAESGKHVWAERYDCVFR
jgi:TolB-like protein